jgi:anti-anti-sigma factor
MEVAIEHVNKILIVGITGRLDTGSAPVFDATLAPELAQPRRHILVNLAGVTYISSAGLRSILQLVKHSAAQGGKVGLFSAPAHILEVIEISGFPSLLDIYPDRATAIGEHAP